MRILLLSDLGSSGQQALLARDVDLRAEILAVSVPDQSPPALSPGLLREIQPRVIVLHDSRFPVSERAPKEFLKTLKHSGARVVSVRELGGLRLSIDRAGWWLENDAGVVGPKN